jgi:hypothetical protein
MNGMVNHAIEILVREKFGRDTWDRIKAGSGVDVEVFGLNESYPDQMTYRLVGTAGRVLGVDASVVLETFGEFWLLAMVRDGYGDLLDINDKTLGEFLRSLPELRERLMTMFPNVSPPQFCCTDCCGESMHLHYYSHRPGLTPMVVGMLRALGQVFATDIASHMIRSRSDGFDHDEFIVKWGAAARGAVTTLAA